MISYVEISSVSIETQGARHFLYSIPVRFYKDNVYWSEEMIPDWEIGQLLGGN